MDASELTKLPLFRRVAPNRLSEAMAAFIPCAIDAGEILMREGESDRAMVIVLAGEVSVQVGAKHLELTRLGRGELVGDMALFGVIDRRAATVVSCKPSRVLLLDSQGLRFLKMKRNPVVRSLEEAALRAVARRLRGTNRLIASVATGKRELPPAPTTGLFGRLAKMVPSTPSKQPDALRVIRGCPAFRSQPIEPLSSLAEQAQLSSVRRGEVILREGDQGNHAHILASGLVDIYLRTQLDTQERIARLRDGALYGAASLVDDEPRTATCIAAEDCWLLRLPGELLMQTDDEPTAAVYRRSMYNALSDQLRMANAHLDFLQGRRSTPDPSITGGQAGEP